MRIVKCKKEPSVIPQLKTRDKPPDIGVKSIGLMPEQDQLFKRAIDFRFLNTDKLETGKIRPQTTVDTKTINKYKNCEYESSERPKTQLFRSRKRKLGEMGFGQATQIFTEEEANKLRRKRYFLVKPPKIESIVYERVRTNSNYFMDMPLAGTLATVRNAPSLIMPKKEPVGIKTI